MVMKKFLYVLTALAASAFMAQAQNPISSVGFSNGDVKLKWVAQTDSSTVIYAVYTRPEGPDAPEKLSLSRTCRLEADDIDYKLIGAENIPIMDEALPAYVVLNEPSQKINFRMEFEKFPSEEPFNLSSRDTSSLCFDFVDVRVDTATTKKLNPEKFLSSASGLICGSYSDEGYDYRFYYRDGFFMAAYSYYTQSYFTVNLDIWNDSDHGVRLRTDQMTAVAQIRRGKSIVDKDLHILDKNEYRNNVASSDYYEAHNTVGSGVAEGVKDGLFFTQLGMPYRSWERIGLRAVSSLIDDAQEELARPRMKELDATREDRISGYIQSQSIAKGENYSGYMKIDYVKNAESFKLVVPINGYDHEFKLNLR